MDQITLRKREATGASGTLQKLPGGHVPAVAPQITSKKEEDAVVRRPSKDIYDTPSHL